MDYIKLEAYVNLLLYRLNIKDGDSLFVSIPKCERTLKDYIEYVANTKGITDIYFYINDLYQGYEKHKEYMSKNAKMLFFRSNEIDEIEKMISDSYDLSLVTILPNKELKEKLGVNYHRTWDYIWDLMNIDEKTPEIYNNINDSKYKKIANSLKEYKELVIMNHYDTLLNLKNINTNSKSNEFPRNGVSLSGNFNGYVTATKTSFMNNDTFDDLIIQIKNNKVVDFDCSSNINILKEIVHDLNVSTMHLTDDSNKFFNIYGTYNNKLLDKYSSPFIKLDYMSKELIMPIGSLSLDIVGYNKKLTKVYENNTFKK